MSASTRFDSRGLFAARSRRILALLGFVLGAVSNLHGDGTAATRPIRKNFVRPGPPANGPAPFLTTAVDVEPEKYGKFSGQLVFPTKDKIAAPFYDVPFAVHVPFEVPFEAGSVRVFVDVNVVWDQPELAAEVFQHDFNHRVPLFRGQNHWSVFNQGLYRVDGTAIPPSSVTWEVDAKKTTPFTARADAPFPLLLNGDAPEPGKLRASSGVESGAFSTDEFRRPFGSSPTSRFVSSTSQPIVLRPAKAGWYVLWFTLAPKLTAWPLTPLRADDTLRATIRVHTMVSRPERVNGGDYFSWAELDYLWDGVEAAPGARAIDQSLIRLQTVDIPVQLRRDGWVFVGTKITPDEAGTKLLAQTLRTAPPDEYRANDVKVQTSATPRGASLTFRADMYERATPSAPFQPVPVYSNTMKWDAVFPPSVPDSSVAEIVVTGSAEAKGSPEELRRPDWPSHSGAVPTWIDPTSSRPPPARDPIGLQRHLLDVIANDSSIDREKYLSRWAWRLDDQPARWWLPATDSRPPTAAEGGRKTYRYFANLVRPYDTAEYMLRVRQLLYADRGPQALFGFTLGPWNVDALYRRQKDLENDKDVVNVRGETKIADEIDPFWKWFVEYSRLLRVQFSEAQMHLTALAPLGTLIRSEELEARRLLRILQTDAENESIATAAGWHSLDLTTARSNDVAAAAAQVAEGILRDSPVALTAGAFNRIRQEAVRHTQQAQADRREALQEMNAALAAYDRIDAKLTEACDRYSDRHPEVLLWRRAMRTERAMKRYAMAMTVGDVAVFRQAVEDSRLGEIDPKIRLFEAQLLRDTGDWPGAIYSLRTAIAVLGKPAANADPRQLDPALGRLRAQAEDMLRDIECAIIRSALEKSQGALKEARKNFYQYLQERGFGETDTASPSPGWWTVGLAPLGTYSREELWAIFGTGVTGALTGILGKPGAEADLLATYETRMTTAFIGLHTILRLRMADCTLQEIAGTGVGGAADGGMSTAAIFAKLPLKKVTGEEFTAGEKHQIGVAVREGLKLPEVAALIANDESSLRRALKAGYWSSRDVTDTWAEWVGDITSPKNLFMNLSGMSVGTVGGVTQGVRLWSNAQAEGVAAMRAIRAAESGTVVLARAAGIERAFETYRNTARGRALVERLAKMHKHYSELGLIDKAIWSGGKAAAAMALQATANYGWKELAGEEGGLMMDLIFMFAGDDDMLIKFIYGKGQTPEILKKLLDQKQLPLLRAQVKELKSLPEELGVWQKVLADLKEGKELSKLEARAQEVVATRTVTAPGIRAPPNSDPGHDLAIALEGSAEGVQQNTNNGALQAAQELQRDLAEEIATKEKRLSQAELIALHLGESGHKPKPLPKPAPQRLLPTPDESMDGAAGGRLPAAPNAGSTWQRAEQALHDGNAEDAEKLFDQAIDEVRSTLRANGELSEDQLQLNLLSIKRNVARSRPLPRRVPPGPASETREISDTLRDSVLASPRRSYHEEFQLPAGGRKPGSSPVSFATVGGEHFVIKELEVDPSGAAPNVAMLLHQVEGEMVAQEIYRALGFDVPGVHVKLEYSGDQITKATFVYRRIMGRRLDQLSAEEMYGFKEELSKLRAVSVLLGDFDRKPDNHMVTPDGHLFAIDTALSDPRGNFPIFRLNQQAPDSYVHMEGYWGRDHYYRRTYNAVDQKTHQLTELGEKFFLSEQALTYNDAIPALERIKELMDNPEKLRSRLRAAYTKAFSGIPAGIDLPQIAAGPQNIEACVDKAVETMGRRHQRLDHVMRGLNWRNGVALPDGMTPPSPMQIPVIPASAPAAAGTGKNRHGDPGGVDASLPDTKGGVAAPNQPAVEVPPTSSDSMVTEGRVNPAPAPPNAGPSTRTEKDPVPAPPDTSQGTRTDTSPVPAPTPTPAPSTSTQGTRTKSAPPATPATPPASSDTSQGARTDPNPPNSKGTTASNEVPHGGAGFMPAPQSNAHSVFSFTLPLAG